MWPRYIKRTIFKKQQPRSTAIAANSRHGTEQIMGNNIRMQAFADDFLER